jgi:hypothetical protein
MITKQQLQKFKRSMCWVNAWRDDEEWEYMKERLIEDMGLVLPEEDVEDE